MLISFVIPKILAFKVVTYESSMSEAKFYVGFNVFVNLFWFEFGVD